MANRKLTPRQEERVCQMLLHSGMTHAEIAREYGISASLVKAISIRNGISRTTHRWTPEEDDYLRRHYVRLGARRLAETAFRKTHPSVNAIQHRASHLGITDHSKYRRKDNG